MRLFFALLPDDNVRETLARRALQVQRRCGGRRLPTESLHLTLLFLGQVPTDRLPMLAAMTTAYSVPPGTLQFARFGAFARRRIVWAGIGDGVGVGSGRSEEDVAAAQDASGLTDLLALQRDLVERITVAGLPIKDEPFRPHVSLLRDATPSDLGGAVASLSLAPVDWSYKRIALMASEPTGGRHRYVELARSPLDVPRDALSGQPG
ncbi:2'-5' RNA ligase family protein [Robbsia sp. KACC 23696]|uniref:2'-5' RNA ligase family protein n=1 Tax=Robbsia sp. KACC 23696 TaxID=3149231 RepID=UPI00325AACB6